MDILVWFPVLRKKHLVFDHRYHCSGRRLQSLCEVEVIPILMRFFFFLSFCLFLCFLIMNGCWMLSNASYLLIDNYDYMIFLL